MHLSCAHLSGWVSGWRFRGFSSMATQVYMQHCPDLLTQSYNSEGFTKSQIP